MSQLPAHDRYDLLTEGRRRGLVDLIDLLLRRVGSVTVPPPLSIQDFCERLNTLGLPLDRYASSSTVLTPEHDALRRLWIKDGGVSEAVYVRAPGEDPNYERSPFYEAATTGAWVEIWLPETADDRFGIIPELRADGYTHYVCIPFHLGNDANGWLAMATKTLGGFTIEDLATIALVTPAVFKMVDARVAWNTLDRLLRTYVGDEPHRVILSGNVKRGQVSTIRSAILFADMRDSTGHTAEISAVQAVDLFNHVFDQIVPPIESRQGEVLKYIGDGLLAIFRETSEVPCDAADRAYAAAAEVLANMAAFNAVDPERRPVELGIALHYGEAAYGNVGSGLRLDFTVIGRDVGLASRIGGMNARLAEPLLMSEAFVERMRKPVRSLGSFAARGFTEPLAVFRPA